MSSNPPIPPDDSLCPRSQAALDALIDAEWQIERVSPEHRERAAKLLGISELLTPDPGACDKLVHATLARCASHAPRSSEPETVELSPGDEDAFEALVGAQLDARRVASGMRARAEHHLSLLHNLELSGPAMGELDANRASLISATLSRVQAAIDTQQSRMVIDPSEIAAPARSWRLPDLGAIAAVLLIGAAVIWPTLGFARDRARQSACLSNLGGVGQALGLYSSDNRGALPMATASLAGAPWWNVGSPEQSNAANLYTLKRQNYATIAQLACAANADACRECNDPQAADWACLSDVSYSYQNMFARRRASMNQSISFVVLADRSPVTTRAFRGEKTVYYNENAFFHNQRGQNALKSDGSALWMATPWTDTGDNIWLPRALENAIKLAEARAQGRAGKGTCQPLRGVEEPDGPEDTFLCP